MVMIYQIFEVKLSDTTESLPSYADAWTSKQWNSSGPPLSKWAFFLIFPYNITEMIMFTRIAKRSWFCGAMDNASAYGFTSIKQKIPGSSPGRIE